jgi:membrane-bound inhibitor of C-type lysozyme
MREIASPLDGFASPFGGGRLSLDPDAAAYIAAVQTADGAALERAVKVALNDFVLGCKSAGIWDAIKASCIMAGARTLAGALVPLKGPAPTNFNFVSGDYNRKTGLKGNGSTKYLDSNRAGNADPLADFHAAVWQTELQSSFFGPLLASRLPTSPDNSSQIIDSDEGNHYQVLCRGVSPALIGLRSPRIANRLVAISLSSTTLTIKYANAIDTETITPVDSVGTTWQVLGRGSGERFSNARLSFYSIGEAIDLAALDTRVSALMTAIDGAIP